MPFQIRTLPVEPPFVCRPDELELGHRGLGPLVWMITCWAPLEDYDLMALDRILKPQLVFEMGRTSFSTEPPDSLFYSFELYFAECHAFLPNGDRQLH